MEKLDKILADWWACKPDGVVLKAARLDDIFGRAAEHLANCSTLPESAIEDAYGLFVPHFPCEFPGAGVPPLLQMLRIGADNLVHFLRFWQAFEELMRRLRQQEEVDDEPVYAEIAEFRDALLRRLDVGGVQCEWLARELGSMQKTSADAAAWEPLQHMLRDVAKGVWHPDARKAATSAVLSADEVTTLLLSWLTELVEDYGHGNRRDKINCVRHVLRCKQSVACLHLGTQAWDVEAALRSSLGGECGSCWSSRGVKLRQSEVECPICAGAYTEGVQPLEMQCCFQVLCSDCYRRLRGQVTVLRCPFCRSRDCRARAGRTCQIPVPVEKRAQSFMGTVGNRAGRLALEAGRALDLMLQRPSIDEWHDAEEGTDSEGNAARSTLSVSRARSVPPQRVSDASHVPPSPRRTHRQLATAPTDGAPPGPVFRGGAGASGRQANPTRGLPHASARPPAASGRRQSEQRPQHQPQTSRRSQPPVEHRRQVSSSVIADSGSVGNSGAPERPSTPRQVHFTAPASPASRASADPRRPHVVGAMPQPSWAELEQGPLLWPSWFGNSFDAGARGSRTVLGGAGL